jgi:3-ketoacyl-CoA synthase
MGREVFGGAPTTTTTQANKVALMSRRVIPLLLLAVVVFLAPRLSSKLPASLLLLKEKLGLSPAAVAVACWAAAAAAWAYAVSRPRPVYLVDLSGYVAGAPHEASRAKTIAHFGRCGRFSDESMAFQKRMLERSGLGERTHFPASLIRVPVDMCLRTAREESHAVIFGVVDDLLRRARVAPSEVGVLIFNSSLLSPTPSFTSLIVNRYGMRHDVVSHNLSGMGCSAGIIAIDLAKRLLQVRYDYHYDGVHVHVNQLAVVQ